MNVPQPGLIPYDEAEQAIAWLNTQHALIYDGTRTLIWCESDDVTLGRKQWRQSAISDFRSFYAAYQVEGTGTGTKMKSIADLWLVHKDARRFRDVIFDPSGNAPAHILNLWRGFDVEPHPGDWSKFQEHLYEIVAGADIACYDYVVGWMARMIQRPSEPAGTAIVLRGPQGAGKGLLAKILGRLLGSHFVHISHTGQLTSRFNGVLADALLLFADEAIWAGDKQGEGALKALITEPTLAIERKGREIMTVRNLVHLMMASNNDWVAPVGVGDRRFCVLDVSDGRVGDQPYFSALTHEQSNGGAGALLHYLLHYDLQHFRLQGLPDTSARRDQMLASLDPLKRWWYEVLLAGVVGTEPWGRVERERFYDSYHSTMKKWNIQYFHSPSELGRAITRFMPSLKSVQSTFGARSYLLPDLAQARTDFAAHLGVVMCWSLPDE